MKTLISNKDLGVQTAINHLILLAALIGLYLTTFINYLVFHTMAEIFSIVIAFSIFVIAWNSKQYSRNSYLLFVGIAYLFIALLDLLHTLSFKGMPLFTDYDYYANQLWIAARYMESMTLLVAFLFLGWNKEVKANTVFAVYTVITAVMIASIFYWKTFPECWIDGIGLTPFKIISEYVICGILAASIFFLQKNRERFEGKIYTILLLSILCTILSEISFTFYLSNYDIFNMVGHYFKIFSFFFIYEAIVKTGIKEPFDLIFFDLDKANSGLKKEIEIRKRTEKEKGKLINNLQQALEEIKTLQGLLPICSVCKSIRDDNGYWNSLESYFDEHSDLQFSHSYCPECAKQHYSQFLPEN
ncbi:MASE3 domain-containing protein [Desulfopila inferna]|uniref:MASE3 domain-containing protein n=1 Tax=Desulfopila inferna TaxID=468528 RepID=UPI0019661EE0|nr:MASE3 domain-containing protein [Desulfopila inferna]MBM9604048.1 hypothetical protein [Desulfopila inferna]